MRTANGVCACDSLEQLVTPIHKIFPCQKMLNLAKEVFISNVHSRCVCANHEHVVKPIHKIFSYQKVLNAAKEVSTWKKKGGSKWMNFLTKFHQKYKITLKSNRIIWLNFKTTEQILKYPEHFQFSVTEKKIVLRK